jgi:hypothetical protein
MSDSAFLEARSSSLEGSLKSAIFELEKHGYVSGNLYGFTCDSQLRTISWGSESYRAVQQHRWMVHAYLSLLLRRSRVDLFETCIWSSFNLSVLPSDRASVA